MTARPYIFTVLLVALSAGCSYNPGYFPEIVPPGPIVQEHAKPRLGSFSDFDPKACKLEVTPDGMVTAPLGAQIVLVGTVSDKDGQPRRSRRIEWLVDGPGDIIEVDESGFYAGRGYKVDNKYAVTYTKYFGNTITRGNKDPRDDVTICPGQTFCRVSSSIPGEMVVTAIAPEVYNWDNGRVVIRIQWGDGRYKFPPSATVRPGSEYTLKTTINNAAGTGPDTITSGCRVRYRLIDGPPASLVSRPGQGIALGQTPSGVQEVETNIDAEGVSAVQLVERDKKTGKTRIAIEIVKPGDNGGQEVVVAKRDTIIEWADPKVNLSVTAPKVAGVNGTYPVSIALENDSGADSRDVQVKVTLSDGATMAQSEPPPMSQDANGTLSFSVPPVTGKSNQTVVLQVKPARIGQVTVIADAVTTDGMQASHKTTTRIDQGKLQLRIISPSVALSGEPIPFKLAVTNGGAAPAENVSLWSQFDAGLSYPSPQNPVVLNVGTLDAGQTKTLDLPLTAKAPGHFTVRASATGSVRSSPPPPRGRAFPI
jgi:hypothetical protein